MASFRRGLGTTLRVFVAILRERLHHGRRLFGRTDPVAPPPRFHVHGEASGAWTLTARGDGIQVSQVGIEVVRFMSPPLGIAMVEYRDRPREWVAPSVERGRVLEAFVGLRDLLGCGGFDLAVFSPTETLELFIDRSGLMEIRTGSWNEPKLRSILTACGFLETLHVPTLPVSRRAGFEWTPDQDRRVRRIHESLALQPVTMDEQDRYG